MTLVLSTPAASRAVAPPLRREWHEILDGSSPTTVAAARSHLVIVSAVSISPRDTTHSGLSRDESIDAA